MPAPLGHVELGDSEEFAHVGYMCVEDEEEDRLLVGRDQLVRYRELEAVTGSRLKVLVTGVLSTGDENRLLVGT